MAPAGAAASNKLTAAAAGAASAAASMAVLYLHTEVSRVWLSLVRVALAGSRRQAAGGRRRRRRRRPGRRWLEITLHPRGASRITHPLRAGRGGAGGGRVEERSRATGGARGYSEWRWEGNREPSNDVVGTRELAEVPAWAVDKPARRLRGRAQRSACGTRICWDPGAGLVWGWHPGGGLYFNSPRSYKPRSCVEARCSLRVGGGRAAARGGTCGGHQLCCLEHLWPVWPCSRAPTVDLQPEPTQLVTEAAWSTCARGAHARPCGGRRGRRPCIPSPPRAFRLPVLQPSGISCQPILDLTTPGCPFFSLLFLGPPLAPAAPCAAPGVALRLLACLVQPAAFHDCLHTRSFAPQDP